jgi:CysZ protein
VRTGALGFGALTMFGLTLPVLNIIIGPAAVIGSTIYLYEMQEKQPRQIDA